MAAVGNLSHSIQTIHTTLSNILAFKDDWFTVSDDFQLQVEILNSMLCNYQEQFRLHQQPTDSPEMKILKKAESTLKKLESRLVGWEEFTEDDRCCSQLRLWSAKLIIVLFPENIEKALKKVEKDIRKIGTFMEERGKFVARLQEEQKGKAITKMIHNTDLYVPIQKPQSAVIKAINKPESQSVILLHGGVGKGKSTLAKSIYFIYGEKRDRGNSKGTGYENSFERLPIWVSCSNCSKDDVSSKQLEILQTYSPTTLGDFQPKEKAGPNSRIAQALRDFLTANKVLMILDDVTDLEFLHAMWAFTREDGKDIKYLVTSRDANICDKMGKPKRVAMEKPTEEEAMKILGSLVGLQVIPKKLQTIAEQIIEAVERNPLALACVARQFQYAKEEEKESKRRWKAIYTGLEKILSDKNAKEKNFVLGSTPRSLAAAMESCINDLDSVDARKLLFLMYECKGEVVPEPILRILHARIQESSCTFDKVRDELVMRELLKPVVNSENKDENGGESTAWCLGALAKIFIKHLVREKEINSVISELLEEPVCDKEALHSSVQCKQLREGKSIDSETARLPIVLCALYFDESHSGVYGAVTKAMARADIPYSKDSFNDLRRQAIEPMVWLLDKQEEEEERWTEEDVSCATKVFLTYTCNHQLDNENLCHLLKLEACTSTQLAILTAIRGVCYVEEKPMFNKNNLVFLQVILHFMDPNKGLTTTRIQEVACRTLATICWKAAEEGQLSLSLIAKVPGIVDILVGMLDGPIAQSSKYVASALRSLACNCDANKTKIANKQGVFFSLKKYLCEDTEPTLQQAAIGVLGNLVYDRDDIASRIGNQDEVLDDLVKHLFMENNPPLRKESMRALANLADSTKALKMMIVENERALVGIQKCLVAQAHIELQRQAARALGSLAHCEEANAILKGRKSLLRGLSSLLVDGIPPTTQYLGALALTLMDQKIGKESSLISSYAYEGRAHALFCMGDFVQSLADLDQVIIQEHLSNISRRCYVLRLRCAVRAKLGDCKGALEDANEALKMEKDLVPFALQERGVLKRMMEDLDGALADLDKGLKLEPDDYERLKHRGYVKFLLKDEEGARADAEWALRIKPLRVDNFNYRKSICLGVTSVEFLGYKLK